MEKFSAMKNYFVEEENDGSSTDTGAESLDDLTDEDSLWEDDSENESVSEDDVDESDAEEDDGSELILSQLDGRGLPSLLFFM